MGQVKCWEIVWNIRSAPGWSRLQYAQISECSPGLEPGATNRKRVISPLNHLGSSRELWNLEFIYKHLFFKCILHRFSWYQVSTREQRLVGITIFPLKYTNGACWIILVSKSGSLFVMCCWILLLASCALEIMSNAIGNASSCASDAKISSRNVDSSCGSLSFGRQERASAIILGLSGR